MIRSLRRPNWFLAVGIVASYSASTASGQGNTFNPYGNSGYADYREFTIPMSNNDPSLPGQARLQSGTLSGYGGTGGTRSNQFEAYSNSLDGLGSDPSGTNRNAISGVPYYKAARYYDKDDRRSYRANATVDRDFQARLAQRNADYNRALAEKDPRKRAELIRRIERNALDQPATAAAKGTVPLTKGTKPPAVRADAVPAARRASSAPTTSSAAPRPAQSAPSSAPVTTSTPAGLTGASTGSNSSSVPIPPPQ